MHPTGPEPASVYWIRRAAIVLVVITLLVALWWLVGSLFGGSDNAAESAPDATSSAAASPEASGESASAEPTDGATGDAEAVACVDTAIKVEATTDASTYAQGSTPKLTLTIINTGDVACKRDVGPKANELEITSGGYHVWSSDDCNASKDSKVRVLQPGDKVASTITWNGRLSQKGCPDGEGELAKPGRYDLEGRNGKVTSEPTAFAISSND
jgi:hypothetical protein